LHLSNRLFDVFWYRGLLTIQMVEQGRVVTDWSANCVYLPAGDRGAAVLSHTSEVDEPTLLRVLGV